MNYVHISEVGIYEEYEFSDFVIVVYDDEGNYSHKDIAFGLEDLKSATNVEWFLPLKEIPSNNV